MTEKNKTVALLLCIIVGYLGIHRFYLGKTKTGVLYLLTGGLCGIGWIVDIILIYTDRFSGVSWQNSSVSQTIQAPAQNAPVVTPVSTPLSKPMPHLLPITDGKGLKYEYENDLCVIDTNAEQLGAELGGLITFKQEFENSNDNEAVAIWQSERKLGYIYRGQSQEIANRWLKNGDLILGFISAIDIPNNKVKYKIGFYKPLEQMEKGTFKLTGIRQKDALGDLRQDNLEYCSVGDAVSVEIDNESEKYIVWSGGGEIGVLPKKAEDFLGSKDKAVGILTKMECDDEGKYAAEVEIYI